jgi:hypothetical protein
MLLLDRQSVFLLFCFPVMLCALKSTLQLFLWKMKDVIIFPCITELQGTQPINVTESEVLLGGASGYQIPEHSYGGFCENGKPWYIDRQGRTSYNSTFEHIPSEHGNQSNDNSHLEKQPKLWVRLVTFLSNNTLPSTIKCLTQR